MFAAVGRENDYMESMDTSDWHWFFQADCGLWHRTEDDPVNPISSSDLDELYLRSPSRIITITTGTGNFTIDFMEYLKTNLRTRQVQRLRRSLCTERTFRCTCIDQPPSAPAVWDMMNPNSPYQAFTVSRQTSEFLDVERYVRDIGLLQEPLRVVYRIQNVDLWTLYNRKKSQLMRIKGQSDIEERWLFHGTSRSNIHNICLYNFDCRIPESRRQNNHILGKGTYFALHAAYADQYSRAHSQGRNSTRIMILARVIVGRYTTGQPHLCKPDGDQNENIHDSCVDNTLYPRIFVIFNSDQIYPGYVLEYGG